MTIYKTCSSKYTNKQIEHLSGVCTFVSFARLLNNSITDCISKKENEDIVGMEITSDGIKVYLETENKLL
jgi:hypothetical protein